MTRLFKPLAAVMVAATICVGTATRVSADTIQYSNFGPANGGLDYYTGAGWTVGNAGVDFAIGETFTALNSGTLSQITLALELITGTNAAMVSLQTDSGGAPSGTVLESWSVSNLPPDDASFHTPITVTDATSAQLVGGTSYWVVASTTLTSTLSWMLSNTGRGGNAVLATHAFSFDGGSTWHTSISTQAAFSVTELGTPGPTTGTPEPSTLALVCIGTGVLAARRLGRRRR